MMLRPACGKLAIVTRRFACSLLVLGAAGCTYNWTEGPRDSGAGDVSAGDVSISDSSAGDSSAGDALGDAGQDVGSPGDASTTCNLLLGQLNYARINAVRCVSQCMQQVADPCGCAISVEDAGSQTAKDYVSAVAAYKMAGCVPDCSGGCMAPAYVCFDRLCI
jgi:hypothetical protein